MIEVEMKFPVARFDTIENRLADWPVEAVEEADHYFNAPDRDFASTDEALRIRRVGNRNRVTYKGPKRDAQTKSRIEVEVALEDGAATAETFAQLLGLLGYRAVAIVRKHRRILRGRREPFAVEVCLDEVDGVGRFVEIEIQATESEFDQARTALLNFARELSLEQSEGRSYLEMLLAEHSTPR